MPRIAHAAHAVSRESTVSYTSFLLRKFERILHSLEAYSIGACRRAGDRFSRMSCFAPEDNLLSAGEHVPCQRRPVFCRKTTRFAPKDMLSTVI